MNLCLKLMKKRDCKIYFSDFVLKQLLFLFLFRVFCQKENTGEKYCSINSCQCRLFKFEGLKIKLFIEYKTEDNSYNSKSNRCCFFVFHMLDIKLVYDEFKQVLNTTLSVWVILEKILSKTSLEWENWCQIELFWKKRASKSNQFQYSKVC